MFITIIVSGFTVYSSTLYKNRAEEKNLVGSLNTPEYTFQPETDEKYTTINLYASEINALGDSSTERKRAHLENILNSIKKIRHKPLLEKFGFGTETTGPTEQIASTNTSEVELVALEQEINRHLALSLTALGLSVTGLLASPIWGIASVPILLYVSIPFFQNGYQALFIERRLNIGVMDSLIAAVCIATGQFFGWALACSFLHFGRKVLSKTEDRSKKSLVNIFDTQEGFVYVLRDEVETSIPIDALEKGDIIVVNAGETISVDGTIVHGIASIDQSVLTGESRPIEMEIGDLVYAPTIVLSGRIQIQVEKAGEETAVAKIGEMLQNTADFKLTTQLRGEAIADSLVLPTIGLAGVALFSMGPLAGVTVLNACFALFMRVLAPIGMLNFLKLTSENAILVKDGRVLELLSKVDTIVFDKTGTLTQAHPSIGCIYLYGNYSEAEVLTFSAAAEYKQTHPIAKAIQKEAKKRGLDMPPLDEAEYKVGYGLTVTVNGHIIHVGSLRFMEVEGLTIPPDVLLTQETCRREGHTLIVIAIDGNIEGALEMHNVARPEAKKIVNELRKYVDTTYIISGDHEAPTRRLAQELDIDHYFAETLPEDKADIIKQLQAEGKFVCFVGDGINDSIALKTAQVSISLSGASTAATDTAQVVLMDGSLNHLAKLFELMDQFDKVMKANLAITIIPGIITVCGTFFLGFQLIHSIVLNQLSLVVGMGNTMSPMVYHQLKKS